MALIRTLLPVSLLATFACIAGAGKIQRGGPSRQQVDKQLASEMRGAAYQRVNEFARALLPSFMALPKNEAGNLPQQTARYILHRLFVDRHGWYIKGLEPNGDSFQAGWEDWVPSYLLEHMEKEVGHRGLNLDELATLAAALEDLVRQEAGDLMEGIHSLLTKLEGPLEGPVEARERPVKRVRESVRIYMASFLSGAVWTAQEAYKQHREFLAEYNDLEKTEQWYQAIIERHLNETTTEPGVQVVKHIAMDVVAEYSAFNDKQCTDLKQILMSSWVKAKTTGRIRLSDFYKMGMRAQQWVFSEKRDYLRALGALDESNMTSPMVIIPNYLSSKSQCLDATNLYAACCRNECEGIIGHLERKIAGPSATPQRIIELVSNLPSDTVPTPRMLDGKLVERLGQIAKTHDHDGEVKLHGRLFAQWLHHAYPNECPYPHEAGVANPASPDEWMGGELMASEEERQQIVDAETCGPEQASEEWAVELPWSHAEELLPHHTVKPSARGARSTGLACKIVGLVAILGAIAGAAAVSGTDAIAQKGSLRHAALAVLTVVLVVTNMVNGVLLAVMVSVGKLLHRLLAMERPKTVADKMAECMV